MQYTIKLIHINSITLQIVNTMLQIENLEFSYHKKGNPIFNGINLTIQPGSVYGLLGKNGIGKSTLLYMMCGLMFPHKGSIRFDGIEVKRRLPETLEKIFLVPEESPFHIDRRLCPSEQCVLSQLQHRSIQSISFRF